MYLRHVALNTSLAAAATWFPFRSALGARLEPETITVINTVPLMLRGAKHYEVAPTQPGTRHPDMPSI